MSYGPVDPTVIEALHVRIDHVTRLGVASAMRMNASALRTQGDLLLGVARTIEDSADRIEKGLEDPPGRPVRMVAVPDGPEAAPKAEREPGMIEPIYVDVASMGGVFLPAEAEMFSEAMLAFLELFDDRLRLSPHFTRAVNEAAEYKVPATEGGARVVAARVEELTQLDAQGGDGEARPDA